MSQNIVQPYRYVTNGAPQVQNCFNTAVYTWTVTTGFVITSGDDPDGNVEGTSTPAPYGRALTSSLTTTSSSKDFVWKFTYERKTGDTANNSLLTLSSFDWADTTPAAGEKFIKLQWSNGNKAFWRAQTGTESKSTVQDSQFLQAVNSTRFYSVTGNGTTWKAQSWSDEDRTVDEESTVDVDFPSDWLTTSDLSKLILGSWAGALKIVASDVSVLWN